MKALLFIFSLYSFTAGAFFWSDPDWISNVKRIKIGEQFKIYSDHSGQDDTCELVSGSTVIAQAGGMVLDPDYYDGCSVSFEGHVQKKLSDGRLCPPEEIEIDLPKVKTRHKYTQTDWNDYGGFYETEYITCWMD